MQAKTRISLPAAPITLAQARLALANHALAPANTMFVVQDISRRPSDSTTLPIADLDWLGLTVLATHNQSARAELYTKSIERLKKINRLYPCFENPDELKAKQDRTARQSRRQVYDRAMLSLTPAQRAQAEANGKVPHWRFLLNEPTRSDPILIAVDGRLHPSLLAAIDDMDLGTTDAAITEDQHPAHTTQTEIRAALGDTRAIALTIIPPLMQDGTRARQLERTPIRQLRQDGIQPGALRACLASPGPWRAEALLARNRAALATLPYEAVAAHLPAGATAPFWAAIRGHIDLPGEARDWWDFAHGTTPPPDPANTALIAALSTL